MKNTDENKIREVLQQVIDPELGANIVDLNMIRKIEIDEGKVTVNLVLTAPGCPLSGWIIQQIRDVVGTLDEVKQVEVELLDEPWEPGDDWKSWFNNPS